MHDATGASLVIEGKLVVYGNPFGVVTNTPRFDWHVQNLSNEIKLMKNDPNCRDQGLIGTSGIHGHHQRLVLLHPRLWASGGHASTRHPNGMLHALESWP